MKRKLLFTAILIACALGGNLYAQIDTDKAYTIANNNDANLFMQDNGDGVVALGATSDYSCWKFIPTGNTDCYYIQNAKTGKYIQGYSASEQEVATGTEGVEYYVKADAEGSYTGKYRMSCTENSPYDFSAGTLGLNWKNNNRVQSFASVAGGNPRSAWILTETTMPEPDPEPNPDPDPIDINSPWTGNVVASGEFYLYNVESGLWLQNNDSKANDWSTRAAIGTRGLDFTIAETDNAFTLGAKFGSASINPDNNYLDTGNNPAWTFTSIPANGDKKAYKINCGNKVLGTVYYHDDGQQNNLFTQTGDQRWYLENPDYNINMTERNTWQLVTRAERIAKMEAEASKENPQDASWLIPSADFANNDRRYNQWTRSLNGGNGRAADGNGIQGSMCVESWNSSNIDFSITISDIPNGTYHMTVQGYYRDGNFNDVMTRRNNGTETIRSYYFAGDVRHPLMSILDEAKEAKVDGAWDRENNGRWYPDSQNSANKCFNLHKGYVNEEIEVVVTTGSLKIGIVKTEGVSSDWTVFDNFKLTYLGSEIDLSQFIEALQSAINSAEAFDKSLTTTVLANALDEAVANGKDKLTSTSEEEISAATTAITNALFAAEAVNVTTLRQTTTLAAAEGIDVSAANDVIANGTTSEEVNAALNVLRTARRLNAVDKQPDIFTGSAPEDGGQYYIYNVGTQRYLTGGVDWGTHAAVNYAAQAATFIKSGDGWRIHTNIRTNSDALNFNGYVDCGGDGDTWYLIEVSAGVYNISQQNSNTGATLLGFSGDRRGNWWQVDTDNEGADNANNQWKLVTKAERDALMATATETQPVDATYYIHAAGFDSHLVDAQLAFPLTKWQTWYTEGKGGNNGVGGWDQDRNWEAWNSGNIKFYQELSGLTPGKYRLTAQAYYRHGNFEQAVNEYDDPKTDGAILFATNGNGETAQSFIVPITSEANKAPGYGRESSIGRFPDDRNETAAQYFEFGLYKNVVNDIIVTADGKLTIGVEKFENNQAEEWIVADNFRLAYLGSVVTVGEDLYATYVAPFDVNFENAGVSAFAAQKNETYVHLEPVTTVPAGTAVVVKAEEAGTYPVAGTTGATLGTENDLIAATEDIAADGSQYILAKQEEGVGFYHATTGIIAAGKGYLVIEAPVKAFYPFDGDATAVSEISESTDYSAPIYNVAGQRLSKMQKGINIVGSKKVLK